MAMYLCTCAEKRLFLFSTTVLWVWLTSQPVLDDVMPTISIRGRDDLLYSSEILGQYLSIPLTLSTYCLYHYCAQGKPNLLGNLVFLFFAVFVLTGTGMHVAVVTIEKQLEEDDKLSNLVDFLHERWSHNHFTYGYFSLLVLCAWMEQFYTFGSDQSVQQIRNDNSGTSSDEAEDTSKQKSDNGLFETSLLKRQILHEGTMDDSSKPLSHDRKNHPGIQLASNTPHSLCNACKGHAQSSWHRHLSESTLWKAFTGYVWPAVFGVYLTVFSFLTGTVIVTVSFYLAVLILTGFVKLKKPRESNKLQASPLLDGISVVAIVGPCAFLILYLVVVTFPASADV